MSYIELTVDQSKVLRDALVDKINELNLVMKECGGDSVPQNVISSFNTLQDVLAKVNQSLNRFNLFVVAVEWFNRNVDKSRTREDYLTQCMSCDDCVVYRRYVSINSFTEPTTIYVVTGSADKLTIISSDGDTHEIVSIDQLIDFMYKNRLQI